MQEWIDWTGEMNGCNVGLIAGLMSIWVIEEWNYE
jgi:hypothetical protein